LREGQIAFGRGRFCLKTAHNFREGPVQFRLEFQTDQKIFFGADMVRSNSPAQNLLGIEVLYIDNQERRWMADQAESKKLESYIPRVPQIYKEGEKASAAAISDPIT
jgi:hypothetical protein